MRSHSLTGPASDAASHAAVVVDLLIIFAGAPRGPGLLRGKPNRALADSLLAALPLHLPRQKTLVKRNRRRLSYLSTKRCAWGTV